MKYGIDSVSCILKNVISVHNVMHSFVVSLLEVIKSKFKSAAVGKKGIMFYQRIISILASLKELVLCSCEKIEWLSTRCSRSSVRTGETYLTVTSNSLERCVYCNRAGQGTSPIIGRYKNQLNKRYRVKFKNLINEILKKRLNDNNVKDLFVTRCKNTKRKSVAKSSRVAQRETENDEESPAWNRRLQI